MGQETHPTPAGGYDPGKLFTVVMEQKGYSYSAELATLLEVSPTTINNIRRRKLALSLKLLTRLQEVSGMSIREMRDLMDDRRREIRSAEPGDSR